MKKKISILLTIVACCAPLLWAACAEKSGTQAKEGYYHAVPKKVHEQKFPFGHGEKLHQKCYYDERDELYFCQFD